MNELMEAPEELRVGADSNGPVTPAPDRPGNERFGADAVPLRPASERDAEVEREERSRLVAAGSRRRSPLRRRGRLLALGVVVVGVVVPAVTQISRGSSGTAPGHLESTAAASVSRTRSLRPPLADAHAVSGRRGASARAERHRHVGGRRRRPHRLPHRQGQAHHQAPPNTAGAAAAEPVPEPEVAPAPEPEQAPEPEPVPEPEPAPPTPTAESTSSPESNTASERSQVEAQFGFEK
jgi:hypothetical protein